jgi:uncharacterized membrane protein (DUF485 family)
MKNKRGGSLFFLVFFLFVVVISFSLFYLNPLSVGNVLKSPEEDYFVETLDKEYDEEEKQEKFSFDLKKLIEASKDNMTSIIIFFAILFSFVILIALSIIYKNRKFSNRFKDTKSPEIKKIEALLEKANNFVDIGDKEGAIKFKKEIESALSELKEKNPELENEVKKLNYSILALD